MRKSLGLIMAVFALTIFLTGNVAQAKTVLSVGMNSVEGDVPYYLAEYFKKAVEEKSKGEVEVKLYPGGQMGGDAEMVENVMSGALDFYSGTISATVPYIPAGAVLDGHWDFDSIAHFRKFLDTGILNEFNKIYADKGMKIVAVAEVGMRNLLSNKKLNTLDDIKGLKVRTMQNKHHINAWKAIGAAPTPMDWSEVYVGLQQKMIDGVEQPYFFIVSAKLYEVQDYMLETQHMAQPASLIMSTAVYNGLPKEVQKIVDEASVEAVQNTRKTVDEMMAGRLKIIKDNGVEVSQASPEMLAEMRKLVAEANDVIKKDVGDEFYAKYKKALEDARK